MNKDILEMVAMNVVIQQSDGFQQGYAMAITDFIDNMISYAKSSDDEITTGFLYTLVDMGESLAKRKEIAHKNLEGAEKIGYKSTHTWLTKDSAPNIRIYTKEEEEIGAR